MIDISLNQSILSLDSLDVSLEEEHEARTQLGNISSIDISGNRALFKLSTFWVGFSNKAMIIFRIRTKHVQI